MKRGTFTMNVEYSLFMTMYVLDEPTKLILLLLITLAVNIYLFIQLLITYSLIRHPQQYISIFNLLGNGYKYFYEREEEELKCIDYETIH